MNDQDLKEEVPTELRCLLMEISLMGLGCGLHSEAFQLLQLLRSVDPHAAYPLLGLAQFYMLNNAVEQAKELLLGLELRQDLRDTPFLKIVQVLRALGDQLSSRSAAATSAVAVQSAADMVVGQHSRIVGAGAKKLLS